MFLCGIGKGAQQKATEITMWAKRAHMLLGHSSEDTRYYAQDGGRSWACLVASTLLVRRVDKGRPGCSSVG